jgi:hypothetical protein
MKIGLLSLYGCSLVEGLSLNLVSWTLMMKVKIVVAIALSFQFAHSFGIIQGSLKSDSILSDESH